MSEQYIYGDFPSIVYLQGLSQFEYKNQAQEMDLEVPGFSKNIIYGSIGKCYHTKFIPKQ